MVNEMILQFMENTICVVSHTHTHTHTHTEPTQTFHQKNENLNQNKNFYPCTWKELKPKIVIKFWKKY